MKEKDRYISNNNENTSDRQLRYMASVKYIKQQIATKWTGTGLENRMHRLMQGNKNNSSNSRKSSR